MSMFFFPSKCYYYAKIVLSVFGTKSLSSIDNDPNTQAVVMDLCFAGFLSSWQVSSLNETVMNQILQLKPGELVCFNQRQLIRVYPSNFRVDSSNFNPQPYWNTGCHMGNRYRQLRSENVCNQSWRRLKCLCWKPLIRFTEQETATDISYPSNRNKPKTKPYPVKHSSK